MQTNHLDVYKSLAEDGKSEQMFKDLGSFIFQETNQMLKDPTCLIVKLKGIGSWHLRKKRMELVVTEFLDRAVEKTREDFSSEVSYLIYLERHLQYKNFQQRLIEYEEYLEIKRDVRQKRNETQVLLKPDTGEDERYQSS